MVAKKPVPFLRWAGSKRWLVPEIATYLPESFERYVEPFVGSGALFFACAAGRSAILGDLVKPLIACYRQVRENPVEVAEAAASWQVDRATFYRVRDLKPQDHIEAAARFIYLNKTCFNGLYRENAKGEFNVPFGLPKSNKVVDESQLQLASEALTNTKFMAADFAETLGNCRPGDWVYVDPPYLVSGKPSGFRDYTAKPFTWEDQERLAMACLDAYSRGAQLLVSSPDGGLIASVLSSAGFQSHRVARYSSIAARSARRGLTSELLLSSPGEEWNECRSSAGYL